MWILFLYSALIFCFITVRGFGLTEMIVGPGKWNIINVQKCDTDDLMLSKYEISRRKINRTCDGYNAIVRIKEEVDSTYAIRIDICQFVDGGCKPLQQMEDTSFERFIKKYFKQTLKRALESAGIVPPDFPIPAGTYEVKSLVIDYSDMPKNGRYGEYGAEINIVKDGVDQLCVNLHAQFRPDEGE